MSQLLIQILISLLFSAFFSAAEIAFVSSNKLLFELEKKKRNLTNRILTVFYKNPNQFISSMLVGNNIALVIYGLLMARLLEPYLMNFIQNDILLLLAQSILATLLILFAGEFIPKTIARINPNFFLSFFSLLLYLVYLILYPISKLISALARLVLFVFGVKLSKSQSHTFGREDLDYFIQKTMEDSPEDAELEQGVQFFHNAMEFSSTKLRDCIVPRTEVVAVDITTPLNELTSFFVKTGVSKIVVFQGDIDNIIGYIHSSELFTQPDDWTKLINSLPFVPENMAANKLMKNMLDKKQSMAVVVDEFGGTAGIITLEDLVEEIFGEIEDEHDTNSLVARKSGDNEYVISGRMEIDNVNKELDLELPESDEYMTIAGLILNYYGNFPKQNEVVKIDQFEFKILKVTRTKIELVKLIIN